MHMVDTGGPRAASASAGPQFSDKLSGKAWAAASARNLRRRLRRGRQEEKSHSSGANTAAPSERTVYVVIPIQVTRYEVIVLGSCGLEASTTKADAAPAAAELVSLEHAQSTHTGTPATFSREVPGLQHRVQQLNDDRNNLLDIMVSLEEHPSPEVQGCFDKANEVLLHIVGLIDEFEQEQVHVHQLSGQSDNIQQALSGPAALLACSLSASSPRGLVSLANKLVVSRNDDTSTIGNYLDVNGIDEGAPPHSDDSFDPDKRHLLQPGRRTRRRIGT